MTEETAEAELAVRGGGELEIWALVHDSCCLAHTHTHTHTHTHHCRMTFQEMNFEPKS